jgi:hypothetical protein
MDKRGFHLSFLIQEKRGAIAWSLTGDTFLNEGVWETLVDREVLFHQLLWVFGIGYTHCSGTHLRFYHYRIGETALKFIELRDIPYKPGFWYRNPLPLGKPKDFVFAPGSLQFLKGYYREVCQVGQLRTILGQ